MYNHYFSSKSQFPMTSSYFLHACLKEVLAEHHFLLFFSRVFFWGDGVLSVKGEHTSAFHLKPTAPTLRLGKAGFLDLRAPARPGLFGPAGRHSPGSTDSLKEKSAAALVVSVSVSSRCRRRRGLWGSQSGGSGSRPAGEPAVAGGVGGPSVP